MIRTILDLGLVKQRKIRFRILSDFRIHSWIFLNKRTLRRYRGFNFALCRIYVFRFASLEFCFQNLPCNRPPTTPPLIKKWNGPHKVKSQHKGGVGDYGEGMECGYELLRSFSHYAVSWAIAEYTMAKNGKLSRLNLKEKSIFGRSN